MSTWKPNNLIQFLKYKWRYFRFKKKKNHTPNLLSLVCTLWNPNVLTFKESTWH